MKVLKAAAIAAVILVPSIAIAYYFWPKDIFIYVYGRDEPVGYVITINGWGVMHGEWNGTDRNQSSSALLHFGKKLVAGPDFELGVQVAGGASLKNRYSIFDGNYFSIYLHDEVLIVQSKAEPPRIGWILG